MLHRRPAVAATMTVLLALGCGGRSGLDVEAPGAAAPVDAATRPPGPGPDDCTWGPVRTPSGAVADPVRFALRDGDVAQDVQLVAHDEGFSLVVGLVGGAAEHAWFDDAILARPTRFVDRLRDGEDALAARLPASARTSHFAIGRRVIDPRTGELGVVLETPVGGLVSGEGWLDAWVGQPFGVEAAVEQLTSGGITTIELETFFPEAPSGVAWDRAGDRSLFLTSELRDAIPIERLRVFERGAAAPVVALERGEAAFAWHHDLALLGSGQVGSIDLMDVPALDVYDPESGARVARWPAPIALFERSGRPGDADLAPRGDEVLAYVSGVFLRFGPEGRVEGIFDEHAQPRRGSLYGGFDVALRGTHAVTATGVLESDDVAVVELRHYECL